MADMQLQAIELACMAIEVQDRETAAKAFRVAAKPTGVVDSKVNVKAELGDVPCTSAHVAACPASGVLAMGVTAKTSFQVKDEASDQVDVKMEDGTATLPIDADNHGDGAVEAQVAVSGIRDLSLM